MNQKLTLFARTCAALVWLCLGNLLCGQEATIDLEFEGQAIDTWHGFKRHKFTFEGAEAWVV
ncbi:MAG: hypothetical protein ACKO8U_01805 [Pirellula sp.]